MNLTSHPVPFARLADLVEGRLSDEERRATEAHVAACPRCAKDVAQIQKTTGLMRADASTDAPRDAIAYAVSLFRTRRAAAQTPSLVERIIATLTFDSSRLAPAFGVRSAAASDSRQLMFSAGANDIDLRLARTEEGWTISGQVLGDCAGGRVEIETESQRAVAELNELCEFSLSAVPDGNYKLLLHLSGAEVLVPEIDLRA